MLVHIWVDVARIQVCGSDREKKAPQTFINWDKQRLEVDRVSVYVFFSGGYPVDMPKYRSILRTDKPDRAMSYDWFVERTTDRSAFEHWCREQACLDFRRTTLFSASSVLALEARR